MSRVFWDTNLVIYLIEDAGDQVAALYVRMRERGDRPFTSADSRRGPREAGRKE